MVADLPARMLQPLIHAHPTVERALWWLTAVELAIVRQWLVLAGRLGEQRMAHLICEILARSGAVGGGRTDRLPSRVRQGLLADITALSTVHVSRVLQGLKTSGLIGLEKGSIVVRDYAGLAILADFDPATWAFPDRRSRTGASVSPGRTSPSSSPCAAPRRGTDRGEAGARTRAAVKPERSLLTGRRGRPHR